MGGLTISEAYSFLTFRGPNFGTQYASDYMPLQFSCVSTKNVKKNKASEKCVGKEDLGGAQGALWCHWMWVLL